jgi:hypothetical protein
VTLLLHVYVWDCVCVEQAGRGELVVKNLRSGQQQAVAFSEALQAVREAITAGAGDQAAGSG